MPKIYENARIVAISLDEGILHLSVETDCEFHIAQIISIPNDPAIFDRIDLPAHDGRNVGNWLRLVVGEGGARQ